MSQTKNWKTASALLVGTTIVLAVALAVVVFSMTLHATGKVKAVGCAVFFDAAATQPCTAIDWGVLSPNTAVNVTVYVKNTGNVPVNWTATASNWTPTAAAAYIAFAADFKGAVNTPPDAVAPAVFTCSISADVTGITTYSYDIILSASG